MKKNNETTADGFQRTFVVDVDIQSAWKAIARRAPGSDDYLVAGFEARCSPVEVDPGKLLRVIKEEEPCKGTEILVRLEHSDSGTRITVSQSGFGAWLADVIEPVSVGWNIIVADLKLYIEKGIAMESHLFSAPPPTINLGCEFKEELSGLELTHVTPNGFCTRAGLQEGDLLLKLNDVRLLHGLQLMDLLRMCHPGDPLDIGWARGSEYMEGSANLG